MTDRISVSRRRSLNWAFGPIILDSFEWPSGRCRTAPLGEIRTRQMPNTYQYRSPLFDSMPNRSRFANRQDSQPVQMINGQSYNQPGIIPMYDNQAVQATTRPRNHHYVRHQQVPTSQSFSSPELAQTPPRQSIQPLQPKLAPQASVSPAKRLELNLKVIQRHDPTIYRILDQIPYAILYKYTILRDPDGSNASGSWEKSEMEGSMFIFERFESFRMAQIIPG
jgi:hypothetical protein